MNIRRFTGTGEWTTRRYLSLLGSILIWGIVAIDAWYLWPTQFHGSTSMVIVSGHSMEPTYFTGDLVIARKTTPSVGDVIVYAPAGLGGGQIVHRIIGGNATEGWQMQGDNNDFIDPFTPKGDEVKGVVMVHYANFGRVTVLLLNPIVWAFVLLTSIVLLVWWGGDNCEDDPEDGDEDDAAGGEAGPDEDDAVEEAQVFAPQDKQPVTNAPEVEARPEPVHVSEADVPRVAGRTFTITARAIAAGFVGLLALGAAASTASAAQLNVNVAGSVATLNYAHCANQTLTAAPGSTGNNGASTAVSVSGIATQCRGLSTTVRLYNSSGVLLVSGTATPNAATFSFPVPSYVVANVKTVVVTVNNWHFFASWSPPVPAFACYAVDTNGAIASGGTCTVSGISVDGWGSGSAFYANVDATVTSSTGNALVVLNLSKAPFPGWTPVSVRGNSDFVAATQPPPGYQCSELPVLRFNRKVANSSWHLYFQISTVPGAYNGQNVICS